MTTPHSVQTCRWGTPTLFLPWPRWYEASQHEWSCTRQGPANVLLDTAICRACPHWLPHSGDLASPAEARTHDGCSYRHMLVRRTDASGLTSEATSGGRTEHGV